MTTPKTIEIKKGNERYEWLMFAQSYILSARILSDILLESKEDHILNTFLEQKLFKSYEFPPHPSYELITPIIFNLKHGIELWLKILITTKTGSVTKIHNIWEEEETKNILSNNSCLNSLIEKYRNNSIFNCCEEFVDKDNTFFRFPPSIFTVNKLEEVTFDLVKNIFEDSLKINEEFRKYIFNKND